MNIEEQLKDIKTQFRLSMNGKVSQSMRERGFNYKLNFGVELPRIKTIVADYEKDYHFALALWKEDTRECKIAAALLMPADAFVPEVADIWVEQIDNIEIAELTVMNLFQHLSYAPALSFKWIADEREFVQTCGFLLVARLLMKKGDMADRPADEFLDQALSGALSDKYNVRQAALLSLRKYMQHDEEHRFRVCRMVENFQQSTDENELALYQMVRNQINE